MNIVSILGSPRKNGNTSVLLNSFLKGAEENSDNNIERIFLQDKSISGCRGCNGCKRIDKSGCVINDDMKDLYQKVKDAEVLVFATPIYWWNITSQLKAFLDRLYALKHNDFKGKKVILLMTYGGELPNSGVELVEKSFRDICEFLDMNFIEVFGICTDEYKPAAENKEGLEKAYSMGKGLK